MSKSDKSTPTVYSPTPVLPRLELKNKPTLVLTERLKRQIDFLHKKVGNNEWSGELITREEGTIHDLDNWKIIAEDIFIADIGTPGYTAYEVDKGGFKSVDIVEMYEKYPGLLDGTLKNHHIHTHHNMGAFFSGTDWSNLNDRALVSNYFLMLIVNHAGAYVAKVAWKALQEGKRPQQLVFSNNVDGMEPISLVGKVSDDEVLVVMNCKIQIMEPEVSIESDFSDRYESVKKAIQEEAAAKYVYPYRNNYGYGGHDDYDQDFYRNQKAGKTMVWSTKEGKMVEAPDFSKTSKTYKKIADMTDKEWEAYQKGELADTLLIKSERKWDLRDAKAMFNDLLGNKAAISYDDCGKLFTKKDKIIWSEPQRESACDSFRYGLRPAFRVIFPTCADSCTDYYTLLETMVKYSKPYKYLTIVRDLVTELEEEMEEVRVEVYEEMSKREKSQLQLPFKA